MTNLAEHQRAATASLTTASEEDCGSAAERYYLAVAQVHATLANAAAAERLAIAVENLPTFEGMLAVYNVGGRS